MRVLYRLVRPLLFLLDPELAHGVGLGLLRVCCKLGWRQRTVSEPVKVMGLSFRNRIGIAAGLDKNAEYLQELGRLGVGFVELGSVSPHPRTGNEKPRLFRLTKHNALINRMGLCNVGLNKFLDNLKRGKFDGVIGVNLGKDVDTPASDALNDYIIGMEAVYAHADYITINISCPHEVGLRQLQFGDQLRELLTALKAKQKVLAQKSGRYVPLAVKISSDIDALEIEIMCREFKAHQIDAVIATNTTQARPGVSELALSHERGGLSGAPLFKRSLEVVSRCYQHLQGDIPIIAVGGIQSASDAKAMLEAGAELIQVYTGLVYKGPGLIKTLTKATSRCNVPAMHESYRVRCDSIPRFLS